MLQGSQMVEQGNVKGAIVVFRNLLEKYPGDAPAVLALSDAYIQVGKPSQAEAELKDLKEKAPRNQDVSILMARIRIAEAKPAEALDLLKPLIEASPAPSTALEQAGHAYLVLGDLKEAQRFYELCLSVAPDTPKARLGLAECHLQNRRFDMAREEVQALLRAHPADKAGLFMLAQLQALANEDDAVIETYGALTNKYPDDLTATYREAFLRLARRGESDHAREVAAKLIKNFPQAPEGYKLNGLAYLTQNQIPSGVEALLTALKLRPDIDTNIFLAQAYAQMGNLETAVNHLQAALTRNPDLDMPRRMLASIYLRQNRLDEAIAETQKLFARTPSDDGGQRILAEALVAKREYDKGLEIFTRLAERDANSPSVFTRKGMLLAMKGLDAEAEADMRRAVELGGDALEPRLFLCMFLSSKNRVDEAVELLASGKRDGQEGALANNAMAKFRVSQGRMNEAMELLEKAKEIDPSVLATYFNLAAIYTASNKLDRAAQEFEAALAIKPDDTRAQQGAAGSREALGQFDKAYEHLERAAKSKDPRASLTLAEYLVRRSENAKALVVIEDSLVNAPKDVNLWVLKGRLHAVAGDEDKTLSALGRVETLNQSLGLLERAKYHLSRKNPDKALEVAGKLRDMNPGSGDYSLPLAEIQELGGQPTDAIATLNTALQADPGNARVLRSLARIEARLNHTENALAYLDKAAAVGMDPANVHALKGAIFQQTGNISQAIVEYEKALRYQERQALALNNLSMIYADQPDSVGKALELALRAYTVEANNPSVLDTLGYALLKSGRSKEALAALEQADKLSPGNPEIARHLSLVRQLMTVPTE